MAGKGKGKGKTGRNQSKPLGREPPTDRFYVILDKLYQTYNGTMTNIPQILKSIIKGEAPKNSKGKSFFTRANKKLYTSASKRKFEVIVMPSENSPIDERLTLLFRWSDLYYEGFHCHGQWFILSGIEGEPPAPCPEVPCKRKKWRVILPFKESYESLGGFNIFVGSDSFNSFYSKMMTAPELYQKGELEKLAGGQMAFPCVVISEALRFVLLFAWVLLQFSSESPEIELRVPEDFTQWFHRWKTDSVPMFFPNPSADIKARLGIVKATDEAPLPRREKAVSNPSSPDQ